MLGRYSSGNECRICHIVTRRGVFDGRERAIIYRNYRLSNNRDTTRRFQRGEVNRIIVNTSLGGSFVKQKAIVQQRDRGKQKKPQLGQLLLTSTSFPADVGNC